MTKTTLKNTAARIGKFRASQDGAVATWFAILLVPMLGFTYGAIKFANLTEQRSSMTDAMDASALAIARQYEVLDVDPCDVATPGPGRVAGKDDEARQQVMRFGREFFAENYAEYGQLYRDRDLTNPLDLEQDLTFDLSCDDITMGVIAYTDMGGVLASQFGLKSVMLNLESNVTLFQQSKIEVALILDVTGSMGKGATYNAGKKSKPNRRIDKMVDAVQGMLDHDKVFGDKEESDRVKFSVVPFNLFVNVGKDYQKADDGKSDRATDWIDGYVGTPQAVYHGTNFLHAYEKGVTNLNYPNEDGTSRIATPTVHEIAVSDKKVNHFDLFRSVPGASWKGCVEARPFPLDEVPHPPGQALSDLEYQRAFVKPTSAVAAPADTNGVINAAWASMGGQPTETEPDPQAVANSRLVPAFNADMPDCTGKGNSGSHCQDLPSTLDDDDYDIDLEGRFWAHDWRPKTGNPNRLEWKAGPVPARLFANKGGDSRNDDFVLDKTFASIHATDDRDKRRYRNLVYDVFQHGLNAGGWTSADQPGVVPNDAKRSEKWHLSRCRTPNTVYVFKQPLMDAMNRFGVAHCNDEWKLRRAYVGVYRASSRSYVGRYENPNTDVWSPSSAASHFTPGRGPNADCGGPLLPLTNKKSDIEDVLAKLQPGGGTNTAIGLAWGWRTLTPDAPFIEAADPDSSRGRHWNKIAILLTDGDNNDDEGFERYSAWGYPAEDRARHSLISGVSDARASQLSIDYKTIRMCHRMRRERIKVYTIGFAIKSGSDAEKMLKACAVEADSYFLASNASDLNKAFDEIADQITELHVSG